MLFIISVDFNTFLYKIEQKVKTKGMDGFIETIKCHCTGNFWISPKGKINAVSDEMDHDCVALSIIEKRYEDEFSLIELDDFRYNICNFLMVKGWIRMSTRGSFRGFMKYSRWNLTQSQRDALFDLTGQVFE